MTAPESFGHDNPHLVDAFSSSLDPIKTAFEDLNVVERQTDIDIQSSAGTSSLRDVVSTTGSGSVPQASQNTGELLVESGTTSGSTANIETAAYGQYVAGYIAQQGVGVRVPSQPSDDAEVRWGYFNTNDGFLWGYDSTGLYVARLRNGTIEEKVYRDNWNGPDIDNFLDSAFDPSDGSIFQIDFAWYGYGAIEFRVVAKDDDASQKTVTVHSMAVTEKSSISNPNQPIRVDVDNGSTTDNVQAYVGGRQFSILGQPTSNFRIASQTVSGASVDSGAWTHTLTFKRKAGDDRRANITARGLDLTTDSNIRAALVVDPNLSGTSYSSPDLTPSSETIVEQSSAGTYDGLGDGVKLWEGHLSSSQGGSINLAQIEDLGQIVPREKPISLLLYGVGSTATITATLRVREEW